MDPHPQGTRSDALHEHEGMQSGQRGREGVLRTSQAGVLPQAQLRRRVNGRVHRHARRVHGPVPEQEDQDGVRHEHHGPAPQARPCGMIGGDGINDESNKMAPPPIINFILNTNIHRSGRGHEGGCGQLGAVRQRHDRTRPERSQAGGRRPVRGTGIHRQLHAAEREIPAVHGALHAQHALQGAAEPSGLGVRGPEGRVRHGITGIRVGQDGVRRRGDGAQEAEAAANCLREGIGETTTYLLPEFPDGHRRRIRTNNMIERLNREIRRRTRVVGSSSDGNSALMLVCARIRYVTDNEWSTRRYLDMSRLDDTLQAAN